MDLEQNTNAWLEHRRKGLGASDIPVIMGISPWNTPYALWEEKTGLVIPDQESKKFITEKGHRLEPKARSLYEVETGFEIPPKLVQREDNPIFKASLDGYNPVQKKIAEIKFVGAGEKWEMAVNGQIPDYYYAQMQWQLFVSGAETNDYVAFNEKDFKIIIITVEPDIKMIKRQVMLAEKFWKLVRDKKEPKLSDRDYKNVVAKEMKVAIDEYSRIKKEINELTVKLEEQKVIITEHPRWNHRRMVHGDVKLLTKTRKGSVDYKKILEEHLPDLDTSGYLKPSTTYKEIKL